MVILDSDHSYAHVLDELRNYGPLVTEGCYLVVADTLLGFLNEDQTPRARSHVWLKGNEPLTAVQQYAEEVDRFEVAPNHGLHLLPRHRDDPYLSRGAGDKFAHCCERAWSEVGAPGDLIVEDRAPRARNHP